MSNALPSAFLDCGQLTLSRNGYRILEEVSLQASKGERLAIIGVSGAGKTTLLRVLAGMERATGIVLLDGKPVPDYARGDNPVGMVFQRPVVYPHLSVRENLALPLATRSQSKSQIEARTAHLAEVLHLTGLMNRRASLLSGGEMQRVAIGRALAYPPKLLLLDEPFANLHQTLRWRMMDYIRQLQREHSLTTILVTHEPQDAMYFAERLAVLSGGRILQIGSVAEVTEAPAALEVAQLLFDPPPNVLGFKRPGQTADVLTAWKPEDTELNPASDGAQPDVLILTGVITDYGRYYDQTLVSVRVDEAIIRVFASRDRRLAIGQELALTVPRSKLYLFDKQTGRRLN